MKTKIILHVSLSIMACMILLAIIFPSEFTAILNKPSMFKHVLFLHIMAATLFFANAVIGILWEFRSLVSGKKEVILHTYETVSWLDARLSSFMILISVMSGIMLSIILGDIWEIGWLSQAFLLFLFSGLIWVLIDIPTQNKIKKIFQEIDPADEDLPQELIRLLKMRLWISLSGTIPILIVFIMMVYKPVLLPVAEWFG